MRYRSAELRRALRYHLMAAPLLLPLSSVVGVLLGGYGYVLPIAALVLAWGIGMGRCMVACFLCGVVAFLHQFVTKIENDNFNTLLNHSGELTLQGTVERTMSNGCILDVDGHDVRVSLRGEHAHWEAGDRLQVRVQPQPYTQPALSGMFDTAAWLRSQGLATNLYCVQAERLGASYSFASVQGVADELREYFSSVLVPQGAESDKRHQVLCALVLGDKTKSEPDTVNTFKRGGCLHIFAVSGLHVGIIGGLLIFLLRFLPVGRTTRTCIILLAVGAYVLVTGLAVPALRAYLMLALVLLGYELKRPVSLLNIWSAAALGILLFAPLQIYNAGFVLSFMVYAAICAAASMVVKEAAWFGPDAFIPRKIYTRGEERLVRADLWVRGIVVVSLSAWLVSLPVTMFFFHSFNLYSALTNMVISPLLPVVMCLGVAALLLSWVPLVGAYVLSAAATAAGWLMQIVSLFGALPGAYVSTATPPPAESVMIYHTGYGHHFCVLGNPGLVINCGNELTARYHTQPALFHGGYKPAALLLSQKRATVSGGRQVLEESWPHMQVLRAEFTDAAPVVFRSDAGQYTLFTPPANLPDSPAQNSTPVVVWDSPKGRVIYLGDASVVTFERIPEALKRAHTVICGYNPSQPVHLNDVVTECRPDMLILLPTAAAMPEELLPTEEDVEIRRVNADEPFLQLP